MLKLDPTKAKGEQACQTDEVMSSLGITKSSKNVQMQTATACNDNFSAHVQNCQQPMLTHEQNNGLQHMMFGNISNESERASRDCDSRLLSSTNMDNESAAQHNNLSQIRCAPIQTRSNAVLETNCRHEVTSNVQLQSNAVNVGDETFIDRNRENLVGTSSIRSQNENVPSNELCIASAACADVVEASNSNNDNRNADEYMFNQDNFSHVNVQTDIDGENCLPPPSYDEVFDRVGSISTRRSLSTNSHFGTL